VTLRRRLSAIALGGAALALLVAASNASVPENALEAAPAEPPRPAAPPSRRFESWPRWTGWSEQCPFHIAPQHALPASPRWAPCSAAGVAAPACRSLVVDGPHGEAHALAVAPLARVTSTGRVLLSFTELAAAYKRWIVADADGPVHAAIAQPRHPGPRCTLVESGLRDDRAAWLVRGDGSSAVSSSRADALVTFAFDDRAPRVIFQNHDAVVSNWVAGERFLVRSAAPARRAEAYAPSGEFLATLHDPRADPEHLPLAGNPPLVEGDAVFFEVGDSRTRALHAFDGRTTRPLLRWPLTDARAAGNLGSDGRVLVWTEGRAPLGDGRYQRTEVMTSPIATDPGALRPRRVAVDPNALIGAAPFTVGCQRAAHWTPEGLLLVHLETGQSTTLPAPTNARWGRPLAVTCDELFVTYFVGARAGILRLKV